MFEDLDKIIQLYLDGVSIEEIARQMAMTVEDISIIVNDIQFYSRPIISGETFEDSQKAENEIIRLYKIGYTDEEIADKVSVDKQVVRFVIDNNCGGCQFPW